MAVLAHDCTDVQLIRVRNVRAPGMALASNADNLHLASCRGDILVEDCVADGHGDDGLNVHSQYAMVTQAWQQNGLTHATVGPHLNGDRTGWDVSFARPVFRVGDEVAVRKIPGLGCTRARITGVEGSTASREQQVVLILQQLASTSTLSPPEITPGDIVEPLDATPASIVVINSTFCNSRASGLILQANNVRVEGNAIQNVSSAAISSGGYWDSFGESPFGSNISISSNRISGCNRGHRTNTGGGWGKGAAIGFQGSFKSAPTASLHHNISITSNLVSAAGGPALEAASVDGLTIQDNKFCLSNSQQNATHLQHCHNAVSTGNQCCIAGGGFQPCR
jgi:hypothetical protein